jgi:hypothetical protein
MGSPNGGIIGVINPTSFGKDTITTKTSTCSSVPLQSGTRIIKSAIVAGGGGGGGGYGGGGSGGLLNIEINAQGTIAATIGGGGATVPNGCTVNQGSDGTNSSLTACGTTYTATGGGGGGASSVPSAPEKVGRPGGSGGGGAGNSGGFPTPNLGGDGSRRFRYRYRKRIKQG